MAGLHRQRPGADAIAPSTGRPAIDLGHGIWMSPGLSNSYLLATGDRPVLINTGMGFEGPLHQRAYAGIAGRPVQAIVLTQGHYDHVGGVDVLRDDDTDVIAQANFEIWRADNERLETFRARNAAFAWMDAIVAAMQYAQESGVGAAAQARPEPTTTFDDHLEVTIGGRRLELLSVPGGETTDAFVVWLPDSRTAFTGNMLGPLFGHVPNLVTIRGDRYRDALAYVDSVDRVLALEPDRLITGHFDPIDGAGVIADELTALRDSMIWVHDRTVDGMNAGTDVHTLMRDIVVPERFDVGEGYGKTSWNVRAIWENYAGWFHHRSTTELYAAPASSVAADVVATAGADTLVEAARTHIDAGRPVRALHLTDLVLAASPESQPARAAAAIATRALLLQSSNFWESAWLRRSIDILEDRSWNRAQFDFADAAVLVTGGSSGIGLAIATTFAEAGAHVTVTGTKPSPDDYEAELARFDYHQLETTDPASINALAHSLRRLDVLVNNAGANFPGGRDEWEPDTFATAIDLNLNGPMRLTTACRPLLAASSFDGGASVVNVVSMSAFRSVPIVPGYGSAKAGLVTLTWNLARLWAADGIRVNAVAPGVIETRMTAPLADLPELRDAEIAHTPMGRFGTPDEIAGAVAFLASSSASYITGHTLAVDGGYLVV